MTCALRWALITGAASSLLEERANVPEGTRRSLLETILAESQRMSRLIGNLLDMIRVESGALQVQKEWQPLEEPVGVALIRLEDRLRDLPSRSRCDPTCPLSHGRRADGAGADQPAGECR